MQRGGARLGYLFPMKENAALTPYATVGYQYWQLEEGGKFDNYFIKNGYSKFYQNGFYGIGLLSQLAINPRLVVNADVMIGRTINPWLRYDAPEVPNPDIGTYIIYQSAFMAPQPFYQAGVGVDYAISNQVHANAGVQYSHSQFASSVTTQSKLAQPHLSIAEWNYHAGLGLSLDSPYDSTQLYTNTVSDDIIHANNQASLFFGYLLQNYAETLPGQDFYFDREVGNVPAIKMAFNKTIQNIYTQFNLAFAGGDTGYKSTIDSSPGSPASNSYTRNAFFDSSIRLGYMFFPSEKYGITPYFVGGYHRWSRDLPAIELGGLLTDGYSEIYQFAWYGAGLFAQFVPSQHWVLSIDGNVSSMENVKNKSWTPYLSPKTYEALLTLKQRFAYNVGVGSDYRFNRDWHALVQLNYWYFTFGRSANRPLPGKNFWYEPNSTTRETSIMIGLGYDLA